MPVVAIIFVMGARVLQYGLAATVVPTPIPYIPADYYGYHVGVGIKNQPPTQKGGRITWKKHWGIF